MITHHLNSASNPILNWLEKTKKWKLLPFQKEAWEKIYAGKSGLISVPTGAGKTFAAYLPALSKLVENPGKGIRILYITPLKALATDLEKALKAPIEDLKLPFRVEKRTGDTLSSQKSRQLKSLPEILLTTPESLSLLLTQKEISQQFVNLQMIIIDEWHELLSTKRGVLLELCLARLKKWCPTTQIWALTATINNLAEAAQVCVGMDRTPTLVTAQMEREVIIDTILPETIEKLPWAGYLGIRMLPYVIEKLDPAIPTLIFTNTRSQAERWYQGIIETKPEWKSLTALHHSSIDKKRRTKIEEEIKNGALSFVVCTSALDLGIDLPTVQKVIQIGSPKSVARLIQRAGRSSHRPLIPCHILLVPTHALQILEMKAYKIALQDHFIEDRFPFKNCYDVLLQHIMTCAIGGGIQKESFFQEIRTTSCYCNLPYDDYLLCLDFLISGGNALTAYSEYRKLVDQMGLLTVDDPKIIRNHKMNIGTIVSDPYAVVKLMRGKSLGTIEESFLTQLKPGSNFLFGGKKLKLIQYKDLTAYTRVTSEKDTQLSVWGGTSLPFSAPLGYLLRKALNEEVEHRENPLLKQILAIQNAKSHVPHDHELLVEIIKSREGWHLFFFPFEGKAIHEGLALLIAHRLSKDTPSTFSISCNDYGFELLSTTYYHESIINPKLFDFTDYQDELVSLINIHETSKATFREIARVAGLIFQGFPSKSKSNRQLQMSSSLLFEVLEKYDVNNLLIKQAKREVLEKYFAQNRFVDVLKRLHDAQIIIKQPTFFTPFSLPLYIERVNHRLSTETIAKRIEMIQKSWTKKT